MENIRSYLTREGWSRDIRKTIERHPKAIKFVRKLAEVAEDIFYDAITPLSMKMYIAEKLEKKEKYFAAKDGFRRVEDSLWKKRTWI